MYENRNGRISFLFLAASCEGMLDSTNKLEGIISVVTIKCRRIRKNDEAYRQSLHTKV